MDEIILTDDILGKDVIDNTGKLLGIVIKIHIDRLKKNFIGITINKNSFGSDLFIGVRNISSFGKNIVFVKDLIFQSLISLKVLCENGKKIGFVYNIDMDKKNLSSIIIKKKFFSLKKIEIKKKNIKTIGDIIVVENF